MHGETVKILAHIHCGNNVSMRQKRGVGFSNSSETIYEMLYTVCGPGSVVTIATAYGLDGAGIEIFNTRPDRL
jgi:hypothetical protein